MTNFISRLLAGQRRRRRSVALGRGLRGLVVPALAYVGWRNRERIRSFFQGLQAHDGDPTRAAGSSDPARS